MEEIPKNLRSSIKIKLSKVPDEKLGEIDDYLEVFLMRGRNKQNNQPLENSLPDLIPENIDIEQEIRSIRREISQELGQRTNHWNI